MKEINRMDRRTGTINELAKAHVRNAVVPTIAELRRELEQLFDGTGYTIDLDDLVCYEDCAQKARTVARVEVLEMPEDLVWDVLLDGVLVCRFANECYEHAQGYAAGLRRGLVSK